MRLHRVAQLAVIVMLVVAASCGGDDGQSATQAITGGGDVNATKTAVANLQATATAAAIASPAATVATAASPAATWTGDFVVHYRFETTPAQTSYVELIDVQYLRHAADPTAFVLGGNSLEFHLSGTLLCQFPRGTSYAGVLVANGASASPVPAPAEADFPLVAGDGMAIPATAGLQCHNDEADDVDLLAAEVRTAPEAIHADPGIPITLLADGSFAPLPDGPVDVTLARITVAPGGALQLPAGAVSLLYVEQGALTLKQVGPGVTLSGQQPGSPVAASPGAELSVAAKGGALIPAGSTTASATASGPATVIAVFIAPA